MMGLVYRRHPGRSVSFFIYLKLVPVWLLETVRCIRTRVIVFIFSASLSFLPGWFAYGHGCGRRLNAVWVSSTASHVLLTALFLSEQCLPPKKCTFGIPKYLHLYTA